MYLRSSSGKLILPFVSVLTAVVFEQILACRTLGPCYFAVIAVASIILQVLTSLTAGCACCLTILPRKSWRCWFFQRLVLKEMFFLRGGGVFIKQIARVNACSGFFF